jgi:hypothetical protein
VKNNLSHRSRVVTFLGKQFKRFDLRFWSVTTAAAMVPAAARTLTLTYSTCLAARAESIQPAHAFNRHMSHVTCHMSHVTCHMSHVTCHASNVRSHTE